VRRLAAGVNRAPIGPSGRLALQLLACCPRMPTDVVGALLGIGRTASAAQLLGRLARAGVARYETARLGPLLSARPVRLWTITPAGAAALADRGLLPTPGDREHLPLGQPVVWREPIRQRDIPLLVASYRLLARAAYELGRKPRVCAFEHPWIRTVGSGVDARKRSVRLPAAAVLVDPESSDRRLARLLLLPDAGTAPLSSYASGLRALVEMRRARNTDKDSEPLLIVGIMGEAGSQERTEAWHSLLRRVAHAAGEPPLCARVLVCESRSTQRGNSKQPPAAQIDQLFALLARHPLLTRDQLASLLATSTPRVARLTARLADRGWVQPIQLGRVPQTNRLGASDHLQRLALAELTPAGRLEAARRLLINAAPARRRHGLIDSHTASRRFVRQMHHTLGVNAFFVDLAAAAVQATRLGTDEALEEWRSAGACGRGRFRPDGYGCYRRGRSRLGFFVEFDRGTERSAQYATKLAAYYRYRNSGDYRRDYNSFPVLLVVATTEAAETRFAYQAYLVMWCRGGIPLQLFLTTTGRILGHPEGVLGPIWRTAGPELRVTRHNRTYWLPGRPPRALDTYRKARRSPPDPAERESKEDVTASMR
jgi:hypothetical protein